METTLLEFIGVVDLVTLITSYDLSFCVKTWLISPNCPRQWPFTSKHSDVTKALWINHGPDVIIPWLLHQFETLAYELHLLSPDHSYLSLYIPRFWGTYCSLYVEACNTSQKELNMQILQHWMTSANQNLHNRAPTCICLTMGPYVNVSRSDLRDFFQNNPLFIPLSFVDHSDLIIRLKLV